MTVENPDRQANNTQASWGEKVWERVKDSLKEWLAAVSRWWEELGEWFKAYQYRTQLFVILAVLPLIIFSAWLTTGMWWIAIPLLLAAIVGLSALYNRLSAGDRELLAERGMVVVGALVSVLIFAGIALWLVVNSMWAAQDQARSNVPITSTATEEIFFLLTHSTTVTAEGQPVQFTFEGFNTSIEPVEVNLQVTKPPNAGLVFAAAPAAETLPLSFALSAGKSVSNSFLLLNDRSFAGGRDRALLTICGRTDANNESCDLAAEVPVWVEGRQGQRLRALLNIRDGGTGSLFSLVGILIPAVIAFLQQYYYLGKLAREARAENTIEIANEITRFRDAVRAGNINNAKKALETLQSKEKELREDEIESLRTAEKLLELAQLSEQSRTLIIETKDEWPDETIMAYVLARKAFKEQRKKLPNDRRTAIFNSLNEGLYYLPVNTAQTSVSDQLWEVEANSVEPVPMRIPEPFASDTNGTTGEPPFAGEKAEDETETLFAQDAFWPHHPLFQKIIPPAGQGGTEGQRNDESYIVHGVPGSGRTAMALALTSPRFYEITRHVLALYVTGLHTIDDIEAFFAARLLEIIQSNPTYLGNLSSDDRRLLVQFLAVTIGIDYARVVVRQAIRKVDELHFNDANAEDRANWSSLAKSQLRLLHQALSEPTVNDASTPIAVRWPNTLVACAKALKLRDVILAVDVSMEPEELEWARLTILDNLQLWHARGLRVILFLPGKEGIKLRPEHGVVKIELLDWKPDTLKAFASHRYEKLKSSNLDSYFDERRIDFNALIAKSVDIEGAYTPRRFMEVWYSDVEQTDISRIAAGRE